MEDIKNAIIERINNRYLVGFVVAFVLWNFRAIIIFFGAGYDVVDKMQYLADNFNDMRHLLIYPAISSLLYYLLVPWFSLLSELYYNIPNLRREMAKQRYNEKILQLRSEELLTKRKTVELEKEIAKTEKNEPSNNDIRIFNYFNRILNEEELDQFCEGLFLNYVCKTDIVKLIDEYLLAARLASNSFVNDAVIAAHSDFVEALSNLREFIKNFFAKADDGGMFLDNASRTKDRERVLGLMVSRARDQYQKYRLLVKRLVQI